MNKLLNKITQGELEVVAANANATLERKTSKTFFNDIEIMASVGIYEMEREVPKPVIISFEAETDIECFGNVVCISDTVNYEHFLHYAKEVAAEGHINLIESFADRLAAKCFIEPRIKTLTITIKKPKAFQETDNVGFSCSYQRS